MTFLFSSIIFDLICTIQAFKQVEDEKKDGHEVPEIEVSLSPSGQRRVSVEQFNIAVFDHNLDNGDKSVTEPHSDDDSDNVTKCNSSLVYLIRFDK